jgi:hypothetical protein
MQRVEFPARRSLRFTFVVALALAAVTATYTDAASATSYRRLRPTISGSPPTSVTVGQTYSFTPTTTDPRQRTLLFSISNKPTWAAFNTSSGALSGVPTASNVGTTSGIVISVSDGYQSAALPSFSVAVASSSSGSGTGTGGSGPPTISGTPPTSVAVGTAYLFQPTASDPAGKPLTFTVLNIPSWAIFNTSTGAMTGFPNSTKTGTYYNIVISVSDGMASAALPPFAVTVGGSSGSTTPTPSAPTITGTPPSSVTVGSTYSFTPSAKSSSSGTLTFSIQQKPAWASFNATTGTLSGTPVAGNVGTYPGIGLSVSDGTSSAALAAFGITVSAAPASGGATSGSATVSWVAPTQNTDGSPLSNLAGFHVYYGTSSTNLSQMQTVSGAGANNAVVGNLTSGGTWYFGVKAYTNTGVESAMSSVSSKAIP